MEPLHAPVCLAVPRACSGSQPWFCSFSGCCRAASQPAGWPPGRGWGFGSTNTAQSGSCTICTLTASNITAARSLPHCRGCHAGVVDAPEHGHLRWCHGLAASPQPPRLAPQSLADGLLLLLAQVSELGASVGLLPQSLRQGGGEGSGGVWPGRQCRRCWWGGGNGGGGSGGSSSSKETAMPAAPAWQQSSHHHGREARTAGKAAGSCHATCAVAPLPAGPGGRPHHTARPSCLQDGRSSEHW